MIGGMAVEVDWGRVVEHGSGMVGGMVVGVNWGRVVEHGSGMVGGIGSEEM